MTRRLWTALAVAGFLATAASIASAADRRVAHTATLLTSSDLLIAGGVNETGTTLSSADIFVTSRGTSTIAAGAMTVARASHTATLLPNSCVLVAGGNAAATDVAVPVPTANAEIYNPATNLWTSPASMATSRYNHTATLLNNGKVLICGGQDGAGNAIASCELYTPGASCTLGSFAAAPPLLQARYNHTAVLQKDGKVWFAGGRNPAVAGQYLPTTERYDPSVPTIGAFQSGPPLTEARAHHTATLMGDGRALVVGGYNARDFLGNTGVLETAEIYDPVTNLVTPAASLTARRQAHASVLLADGAVMAQGGLGNVTTTFMTPSGNFKSGSSLTGTFSGPSTMNITGVTGLLDIDFLLSQPVIGQIVNGEIWLSSPTVTFPSGKAYFTPASQTNPAVGLRMNLAGVDVGCRLPTGVPAGNCGNIQRTALPMQNLQGQVVYSPRIGITPIGTANLTSGYLLFAPSPLNSGSGPASLLAGSTFTTTITISMGNELIGFNLINGTLRITDASFTQTSSFTVTLASGTGTIPLTPITADVNGNGQATFSITFNNIAGTMTWIGQGSQAFTSPQAIPMGASPLALTLTMNMSYVADGLNLTGQPFTVSLSTVVIRRMIFADNENYNPKANLWTLAPAGGGLTSVSAADQRYGQSATLLPNNDAVFLGGRACSGATCASQTATSAISFQLLSAEKNFSNPTGLLAGVRAFHTATLLPDGNILVAGGTNGPSILHSAALFNPQTETFSPTAQPMRSVRDLHTATLLPNGRVLVAGGFTTNAVSTGSTNASEIYYPDTKMFVETTPMISSRSNHSAIMLPDGKVFAAGGFGPDDVITGTAEMYVSTQARWVAAATMPGGCERAIHATVQLKDGRIMLIGGVNAGGILASSARYNPAANTWDCAAAAMPTALRSHSATLLFDGRVLVAGGNDGFGEANVSYIYDPGADTWTATDPAPLLEPRFNHTASLLPNGTVMITGGSERFGNVPISIETFHINANSWVTGGVKFNAGPRAFHTMTLALNNKMYGIGGSDGVIGGAGVALRSTVESGYFTSTPDRFSKGAPPSLRQSTVTATSATPFLPATNLSVIGDQFRGGTEASGGGAASANSAFSFPHLVLQQVDGSGGAASQSNGGFVVNLTTQIYLNSANFATLNTTVTVALPATSNAMPFGWYALRVGANGIYSNGKLVQVGPPKPTAAPTNLLSTIQNVSSITWTWSLVAGVDGYNVYNATTGVFQSTVAAGAAPTYVQTGLAPSATSSIIVAAYTLTGDGPLAASPTYFTLPAVPITVSIASVTSSNLLLFWGTNGNMFPGTRYEVSQSSDNFVSSFSIPIPALFALTTNFATINNLTANTTYYFRVRAFNLAGLPSPFGVVVSTRTRIPVTQPTVAARTTHSIDWSWPDPGGVNSFRIHNATSSTLIATSILPSYSDVGLSTNTLRSVRVSAVTDAGEGPLSASASAYTMAATPGAFTPDMVPSTSAVQVIWSNNENPLATQYRVRLNTLDDNSVMKSSVTALTTDFSTTFQNLLPSALFSYSIVAINGDGIDSDTPEVVVGSTWTLPATPIPLKVVGTNPFSITVDWSPNQNSSSTTYQLTYSTDAFTANVITAVPFSLNFGATNFVIAGLITDTTYSMRVIARNRFGQLSPFSNVVTTRTFNGGAAAGSLAGLLAFNSDSQIFGTLGNGRQILLRAPARAFPSNVTVTISSFNIVGTLCPNATNIAFSITNSPALQPNGSLYFTFSFAAAELGTIPASRALLLRYEPGSGICVPLETVVDSSALQMTARINHFSLFQVGSVPLASGPETARIFPNPYHAARDGYVTIDNIPAGARVRVFTLRGESVLDMRANSSGLLTWSGTNGFGRAVASGVYLVMVESGTDKKILKLALIR